MQNENIRVLSGDIGGTKTRLAIATVRGNEVHIEHEVSYPSRQYQHFDTLLAEFLSGVGVPQVAAFGIAGPVQGRVVQTTNLPWQIDADALQQRFGFSRCLLLNDLEATACGLPALGPDDLLTLQAGAPDACGNQAVIAAGTGLGEAGLFWDGEQHQPFATEGGHASFAPSNTLEFALLRHLQQLFGHVSWERVVSGMGVVSIHEFLCQYRQTAAPDWLVAEMSTGDAAAAISNAGLSGGDVICAQTMECFVKLYGAEAGNLALKTMSRGGLFIGGGIAPKILPMLQSELFLDAFLAKGRMRPLLEAMPVRVILNDRAALYGPALRAAQG
ncbi:MAG: glucokinase [Gallionella sp.]|nr:glucokinase [Gallionella sp.]MDD4946029.1 glucokinase [Gallionella sp.]MDD5612455.1 glucokinase [Gallionella sp.]